MHYKIQTYADLRTICQNILDKIIAPVCGIHDVCADYWLSDIETYTMGDEESRDLILTQIAETYRLTEDQMIYIDSYTTLIQIALFIYLQDRPEPSE